MQKEEEEEKKDDRSAPEDETIEGSIKETPSVFNESSRNMAAAQIARVEK